MWANGHKWVDIFRAGGVTLAVIAVCSIGSLALALERTIALWRLLDRTRGLAETVRRCLYRGAYAEARAACERSASPMAEVFLVGFERAQSKGAHTLAAAVDRERQRVMLMLKGQLWWLGTIGATAPFVGLFGTVWGILRAFEQIGATHQAGIDVVGPGIAEALITTAAGIVVAIEAVVLYNYFMARLSRIGLETRLLAEEFIELVEEFRGRQHEFPTTTPAAGTATASTGTNGG